MSALKSRNKQTNVAEPKPSALATEDPVQPFSAGAIVRMLFYTFLMVTVPISSYFVSKKWVYEGVMMYSEQDSSIPAALTAVAFVHIVLGLFVYQAYSADAPASRKKTD